ncbi:hypothetical protein TSAR_010233 [Trichomalopsis sarcophagae]|uniref:Carboxylic ester hydrolase n=1 Tax=Trichomalopsis sarcophagae TaxID=543379 RepID=A0A232FJU0_9HYME|nr:hypothetical protein TSAR_010233 [Trichomalopsis sarcophagae]
MEEGPIVSISDGKIQGAKRRSLLGVDYFAFKGIPYAQPPIGPLRFKDPQPVIKWSGVRDASQHAGDVSMQYESDGPKPWGIIGSEDCLYLNVYTNSMTERKRPVMYYIHGGGFVEDSGNDCIYREDYLVTMDMVLVSVNYRLGPMGFLNLGHEVAAGNQGLRDIICGLKWVQRNIEQFGGDPNNVTIFGNSSGSMTCHLFSLLPTVKGLFHKAILQSGSIFTTRNLFTGKNVMNGFKIASLLGLDSQDPEKVIEFLRGVPAKKIVELHGKILSEYEKTVEGQMEYSPTFDAPYIKDPIIPKLLPDLIENDADIPIMLGHTPNESLLSFMGRFDDEENFKFYDDNIEEMMKHKLRLQDPSKFPEIMKSLREFYLHDKPINKENVWNLINLLSDFFAFCNRKTVDLRNEHAKAPTYLYNFSYMGNEPTMYQFDQGPQPLKGVAHADELSYLFYLTYMKQDGDQFPQEGTTDRLVVERLARIKPTPSTDDRYLTTTWKASTKDKLHYLDIGAELELKDERNLPNRAIYDKFAKIYLF